MTRRPDPEARAASREGSGERLSWIFLVPLAPYLYPALSGLLAHSDVPIYLGRYSASFLAFNVLSVLVIALVAGAWWRRSHRGLQLGYLALIAITVLVPMNNQLLVLPGILWVLPTIRLASGIALALSAFDRQRLGLGRSRGLSIALASIVVTLSLIDLVLLVMITTFPEERQTGERLREVYDLSTIEPADVVIVGDSFVWGQGVAEPERFGDRLETLLESDGRRSRVYSLGEIGTGLTRYIELLESLPADARAGRVIVSFYLNDMPAHESLRVRLQALSTAVGRGVPSFQLVSDKISTFLTPTVDAYHDFLAEALRPENPTYAERHDVLERRFADLGRLAAQHSRAKPLMLILPIMVDFAEYPLDDAHAMLAALARASGFEVLDLLPVFRAQLGDGVAHRAAPNDSHFDARTHDLLARTLAQMDLLRFDAEADSKASERAWASGSGPPDRARRRAMPN